MTRPRSNLSLLDRANALVTAQQRAEERANPHALDGVSLFTHHTVGWQRMEHGGSVPIREPYDQPYWRWYCRCGAVGGRSATEAACRASHTRHAESVH